MRTIASALVVVLVNGCAEAESDSCIRTVDAGVNSALAKELSAQGVKYRWDEIRGVCVPKQSAEALDAAYHRINEYRSEVAALLSDECEQRQLVEWARHENLPFDLAATTKSDGTPGGTMMIIRSLTPEEVAANRRKLDAELPKVKSCKS